jgi:hypothetical protein
MLKSGIKSEIHTETFIFPNRDENDSSWVHFSKYWAMRNGKEQVHGVSRCNVSGHSFSHDKLLRNSNGWLVG